MRELRRCPDVFVKSIKSNNSPMDMLILKLSIYSCHSTSEIREAISSVLLEYEDLLPKSKNGLILIKPNFNSTMNALTGNTTDLRILVAVIEALISRDFQNIVIGEGTSSGFFRNRINVFERLRIDNIAQKYGIELLDLNYAEYEEIELEQQKAKIAKITQEAKFFVNIPKIKTHFEVGMSVCLKNLIGCLVGLDEKQKVHCNLHKNILRLSKYVKPHLHVVDGLIAMQGNGPSRGTPLRTDIILAGQNPFLLDLACAKYAGIDYKIIPTLNLAEKLGFLSQEDFSLVDKLDITPQKLEFPKVNRVTQFVNDQRWQKYFIAIRLSSAFRWIFDTAFIGKLLNLTGLRQDVFCKENLEIEYFGRERDECIMCGKCAEFCPMNLNLPEEIGNLEKGCIECLYCFLVCPTKEIKFRGKLGFLAEQISQYDRITRAL